jgi:LmbE family N-acetylglucosaminyl deacetylase
MKSNPNSIIVFCAHSDDQILGVGGTLAKYAKEGKDITTVIFSYGESSHFWLQRKVTVEMRVKEAQKADRVIGGSGVIFFGLTENKFADETDEKDIFHRIIALITDLKPSKIFTHNTDDPHPDHRAVTKIVLDALFEMDYKCDVYSFQIWSPIKFTERNSPKLVVDISDTFKTKMEALNCFKSQKLSVYILLPSMFFSVLIQGINNHKRFAEVFYKIR